MATILSEGPVCDGYDVTAEGSVVGRFTVHFTSAPTDAAKLAQVAAVEERLAAADEELYAIIAEDGTYA